MDRRFILKINKELLLYITIIYYTSKLLWDSMVPFVFTIGTLIVCLWYTIKWISSISCKKDLVLIAYMLLFSLYIIFDAIINDEKPQLYRAIYEYIFYALPFFLVLYCLPKVNLSNLTKKSVWLGIIISILSWYEYLSRTHLLNVHKGRSTGILYGGDYAFRSACFSRSALSHGVILGFFAVMAFSRYLRSLKKKDLIITIFLFFSILTTSSRGPLVSATIALFVMYILYSIYVEHGSVKKMISVSLIFVIVILCLFILFSDFQVGNPTIDYFLLRIRNIINWSSDAGNVGRISRWQWSIELFKRNPILGIGPSKTGSWGEGSLGVTESGVLKRLCELGIVGFALHYLFICVVFISSFKRIKSSKYDISQKIIQFLGILFLIITNDFIVQSTEEPAVCFIMWFSLAGLIYLQRNCN